MKAGKSPIRLAAVFLFLVSSGLPEATRAQTAQGRLVDRDTGVPVEGALVLLLNPDFETEGGSLTNEDGRFLIRAPGSGRFILRAFRIGYETITSEPIDLLQGDVFDIRLETGVSPIELSELRVEAESRCVVRPGENLELARVWEEARKALTVQEWAEGENLLRFQAIKFQREMDPESNLVLSETRQVMEGVSSNPVQSRPGEELMAQGFVRPVEDGRFDYFGTDASVLLSDPFLDTHCFRFRVSAESPDLIGLAFEPVREKRPPDIEGTLWLDRNTARLRFLEFTYDWAPWEAAAGVAKGRVEFLELPNGAWTIPRWWIRMPTLNLQFPVEEGDRPTARLIGTLEVGWEVQEVSTLTRQLVAPRALGAVRGLVRDAVSHRPLPGVRVVLSGTPRAAVTDMDGEFVMEGVPEGGYEVSFTNPLLDSLGVSLRGEEINVRGEQSAGVLLESPPKGGILETLCGSPAGDPTPAVLTGTVWMTGTGEPVADATVDVEWEVREYRGAERRRGRIAVATDDKGRYRACVVPAGRGINVSATSGDFRSASQRLEAPPGDVIFLDLWIGWENGGRIRQEPRGLDP